MKALLVRRLLVSRGRSRRIGFALCVCAGALAIAPHVDAQSLDSRPPRTPAQQDHPRRARTVRPDRNDWAPGPKRDYADDVERTQFTDGQVDITSLETRIHDLSAKVRELNDLLQRQKEADEPVRFVPRPMRVTLLERHQPPHVPKTYGEALDRVVRERARAIAAVFGDAEERARLAIDPEPSEARRLLEPIDAWLAVPSTPEEITYGRLCAIVYATLLEARANIDRPEPLPAVHKLLRDLHVDRAALTEHVQRSFLLDNPTVWRDLGAALAAAATAYPEPSGMREFLTWLAESIATDLKDEALARVVYPYRGDARGQFDAAAENATHDNGEVLKLQLELQRMLVEAKTLRGARRASEGTTAAWQHRLLQAERELDRMLRAVDSEREAVTTLARRVPMDDVTGPATDLAIDAFAIEPVEEVASDDLTTQH